MTTFLSVAYLFAEGSVLGWCIELIFRRFIDPDNVKKKWVNPGFLTGPYLPLYGFVLIMLYSMRRMENYLPIENTFLRKAALFLLMALFITIFEFETGYIFIIKLKIVLWDYTGYFGNVMAIICPLYSFYWCLLSLFYCLVLDPAVAFLIEKQKELPQMSFFLGMFYGIFLIDLAISVKNLINLSEFAWKHNILIRIDEFREQIQNFRIGNRQKHIFFQPMRFTDTMSASLERYREFLSKVKPKAIQQKISDRRARKDEKEQ